MSPHQDMMEKSRRTRQAMYLVASIYVGAGFFVTIPAAIAGNTIIAFLGFLVISGVLAVAAIVNSLLQVSARVGAMEEKIDALTSLHATMARNTQTSTIGSAADAFVQQANNPEIVDLSDAGVEDPSSLAAATLDQEVFPRLVTESDEPSIQDPFRYDTVASQTHNSIDSESSDDHVAESTANGRNGHSPSFKETMQLWVAARGAGDLSACRAIISSMPESADPDLVETMHEQLDELNETARHSLREKFAEHVRAGEIAGAIEIGERLRELFPDSDLAEEFVQLKPLLEKRIDSHTMQI